MLARLAGEEEHLSAREAAPEADLGQGGDVRLAEAAEQPQKTQVPQRSSPLHLHLRRDAAQHRRHRVGRQPRMRPEHPRDPAPPTDSHHDDSTPVIHTTGPQNRGISSPRVSPRTRPVVGKPPPRPHCLVGRATHFRARSVTDLMRLGTVLGLRFDIPTLSRNIHLNGSSTPAEAARYRSICVRLDLCGGVPERRECARPVPVPPGRLAPVGLGVRERSGPRGSAMSAPASAGRTR